jgi:hypothetical protein
LARRFFGRANLGAENLVLRPEEVLVVSRVPDISHLSDAIRLMDGTHFIDTKVAAVEATVYRSKDVVASANRELERHQQWFECHRELYAEDLKRAERQLRRLGVLRSCKQTVIFPMRLAASAGVTLLHAARGALTNRAKHKQLRPPFQKNDKAVNHRVNAVAKF